MRSAKSRGIHREPAEVKYSMGGNWQTPIKPTRFETPCEYCEATVKRWKKPARFCGIKCERRFYSSRALLRQKVLFNAGLRQCTLCQQIKLIDQFWFCKCRPNSRCKECSNARQRQTRKFYPADDSSRERARKWRTANPDLFKGRIKAWRLDNPERAIMQSHKRRALLQSAGIYKVHLNELHKLLVRQQSRCAICSSDIADRSLRELDHIIPIVRGGRHSIGNLMWLCRSCNRRKTSRLLIQLKREISWFPYLP